jgi:hypothetical protein
LLSVCLRVSLHIVARQRLSKHVTASANTYATIELLDSSFSMRSWVPARPRSRDDCAGEHQRQITALHCTALHFVLPELLVNLLDIKNCRYFERGQRRFFKIKFKFRLDIQIRKQIHEEFWF